MRTVAIRRYNTRIICLSLPVILITMRDLLFYGGTVVFWIGIIGCYYFMNQLRREHPGVRMNFKEMRKLSQQGSANAKSGVTLLLMAAGGVVAQIASVIVDQSL